MKVLLPLIPIVAGLFLQYSDTISGLVSANPKLSIVVGAVVAAITWVIKSPWFKAEFPDAPKA